MPKMKCAAYDAGFKLRVVEFAENSNNSAAMREFDVNENWLETGVRTRQS